MYRGKAREPGRGRHYTCDRMDLPHTANIVLHVGAGSLALALGLVMLARRKGTPAHRRRGRLFLVLYFTVIATAALGFVFFRPDPALAAITLLSAYLIWSGWRTILRGAASPSRLDGAAALAAAASGLALALYAHGGAGAFWKPAVTGPIAFALLLWGIYDLARLFFPAHWRHRIWRLEHGLKLIAAVGALASAGLGTVFPQFAPWSQVGPSIAATAFCVLFLSHSWRRYAGQ